MFKPTHLIAACIVCAFGVTAAYAEGEAKWTVVIEEDVATIQSSDDVKTKHVQATIKALQGTGMKKFVLKSRPAEKQSHGESKTWFAIDVEDETAEITAAKALPYKHVAGLVQHLSKAGIKKIKFAAPGKE